MKSLCEARRKPRHAQKMLLQSLPVRRGFAFKAVCVELRFGHKSNLAASCIERPVLRKRTVPYRAGATFRGRARARPSKQGPRVGIWLRTARRAERPPAGGSPSRVEPRGHSWNAQEPWSNRYSGGVSARRAREGYGLGGLWCKETGHLLVSAREHLATDQPLLTRGRPPPLGPYSTLTFGQLVIFLAVPC